MEDFLLSPKEVCWMLLMRTSAVDAQRKNHIPHGHPCIFYEMTLFVSKCWERFRTKRVSEIINSPLHVGIMDMHLLAFREEGLRPHKLPYAITIQHFFLNISSLWGDDICSFKQMALSYTSKINSAHLLTFSQYLLCARQCTKQ